MDFVDEIVQRVALAVAAGKSIAFWGWDEALFARLVSSGLLEKAKFSLVSDWEGHYGFTIFGKRFGPPDGLRQDRPDDVIIALRQNAIPVYERLVREFGFKPLHVFMVRSNWQTRLYQPDPAFSELISAIPKTIAGGLSGPEVVMHAFEAVKHVVTNRVPGHIVNLGVFQGWSMYFFSSILERFGQADRSVIGFDTFEGFSQTNEGWDAFCDYQCTLGKTGWNFFKNTSVDIVSKNLSRFKNTKLIKGDIRETIKRLPAGPIAVALFDMDDYTPTAVALPKMYENLSPGGVFIFDHFSYHTLADGSAIGQRLAMLEFLEKHPMFNLNGTNIFVR